MFGYSDTWYHLNNEQVKVLYSDVSNIQIPTVHYISISISTSSSCTYRFALHDYRPSLFAPHFLKHNFCRFAEVFGKILNQKSWTSAKAKSLDSVDPILAIERHFLVF